MNAREKKYRTYFDENGQFMLSELISEVVWIEARLKENREKIQSAPLFIKYEHGGGQSGYTKNPLYETYNDLLKNYRACLQMLIENAKGKEATEKLTEMRKQARNLRAV